MGVATQLTDLTDLRTALLNAVRDAPGVTATSNIADRYVNLALHDMHIGDNFSWAIRDAILVTHPTYTTGTVSIDQGATALVGVGTAWATNNVFGQANARNGGKLKLGGVSDVYEVSGTPTALAITLRSRFTGADLTVASATTYTYFEDEYDLASDFFRPVDLRQFSDPADIQLIPPTQFRRSYLRNSTTGTPKVATIFDDPFGTTTARVMRVQFHPAPDKAYTIPYFYVTTNLAVSSAGAAQTQLTAASDEPIVPLRYRHLILYHSLYLWWSHRKDDTRAHDARAEYNDMKDRISRDTSIVSERARLVIRRRNYLPRYAASARYATGTWFDELQDMR